MILIEQVAKEVVSKKTKRKYLVVLSNEQILNPEVKSTTIDFELYEIDDLSNPVSTGELVLSFKPDKYVEAIKDVVLEYEKA
jgi:hypothetical protein